MSGSHLSHSETFLKQAFHIVSGLALALAVQKVLIASPPLLRLSAFARARALSPPPRAVAETHLRI